MTFVTDAMRDEVRQAVQELEKNTSGEMVCVVAPASARYILFPLLYASLISLFLPLANMFLVTKPVTFSCQTLAFMALSLLFLLTPLRLCLTPRGIRDANCRRAAFEQFFVQQMHMTEERTGVMLYVSVAEHYVELLADQGINAKVLPDQWEGIVDAFIKDVRAGKVHEGFLSAVRACATVLARHFPVQRGDVNELSDNLVELPPPGFLS